MINGVDESQREPFEADVGDFWGSDAVQRHHAEELCYQNGKTYVFVERVHVRVVVRLVALVLDGEGHFRFDFFEEFHREHRYIEQIMENELLLLFAGFIKNLFIVFRCLPDTIR